MTNALKSVRQADPLSMLTLVAFVLLLALVCVRMTMMETVREAFDFGQSMGISLPASPSAPTSLVLDGLCVLPALLVLVRRAIDPKYVLRGHWSFVPLFLLGVWAFVSTQWASDKYITLVTASDFASAVAVGWAACQLVRSWQRLRVVLGTIVGLLLIGCAQAAAYKFVEMPEMISEWDRIKTSHFQEQQWSPDSFAAQQFDRKIRAGQLMGFYKSPNTFAAVMALGVVVCAALALQRRADKDEPGFAGAFAVIGVLGVIVMLGTGSRTALAGLVLCAIAAAILWRFRTTLLANHNRAYVAGIALVALGVAAVVVTGLTTGGLLHDSMTFRWRYWVGSWHVLMDHPILGTGFSNFASAYLQHRLPEATEEIKDPHNVFIRFAVELGAVGLLLLVTWLARAAWEATRSHAPAATPKSTDAGKTDSALPLLGAIVVTFAVIRLAVNTPVSLTIIEVMKGGLFAFMLLFGLILTVCRSSTIFSADTRAGPWLLWGALIALGGFLLHNGVDFAMSENGPLLLMVLLLGAVLGVRHPGVAGEKPRTTSALLALGMMFAGVLAWGTTVLLPVVVAQRKANAAQMMVPQSRFEALGLYRQAIAESPVPNYDFASRAADVADDVQQRLTFLTLAADADVRNPAPLLTRARLRRSMPDATDADKRLVVTDYSGVVARNPVDPALRVEFAEYLESINQSADADIQLRAALSANARMDAAEPRRLKPEDVEQMNKRLGL